MNMSHKNSSRTKTRTYLTIGTNSSAWLTSRRQFTSYPSIASPAEICIQYAFTVSTCGPDFLTISPVVVLNCDINRKWRTTEDIIAYRHFSVEAQNTENPFDLHHKPKTKSKAVNGWRFSHRPLVRLNVKEDRGEDTFRVKFNVRKMAAGFYYFLLSLSQSGSFSFLEQNSTPRFFNTSTFKKRHHFSNVDYWDWSECLVVTKMV